ncbi:hypothetical protein ACSSS7_006777 [Eimeria intestinalis]
MPYIGLGLKVRQYVSEKRVLVAAAAAVRVYVHRRRQHTRLSSEARLQQQGQQLSVNQRQRHGFLSTHYYFSLSDAAEKKEEKGLVTFQWREPWVEWYEFVGIASASPSFLINGILDNSLRSSVSARLSVSSDEKQQQQEEKAAAPGEMKLFFYPECNAKSRLWKKEKGGATGAASILLRPSVAAFSFSFVACIMLVDRGQAWGAEAAATGSSSSSSSKKRAIFYLKQKLQSLLSCCSSMAKRERAKAKKSVFVRWEKGEQASKRLFMASLMNALLLFFSISSSSVAGAKRRLEGPILSPLYAAACCILAAVVVVAMPCCCCSSNSNSNSKVNGATAAGVAEGPPAAVGLQ